MREVEAVARDLREPSAARAWRGSRTSTGRHVIPKGDAEHRKKDCVVVVCNQ